MSDLIKLATQLGKQLNIQNAQISTAESCTGGGLAHAITAVSGSSNWFEVGFITYSNLQKHQQLNVPLKLFEQFGAVSSEVALSMAHGIKLKSNARFVTSITGIAGPTGGTQTKPVGTVWFGFGDETKFYSVKQLFHGNREQIRLQAVEYALSELIKLSSKIYV